MIQSLFLLSPTGEILIERHFRGVKTSRSVCTYYWDKASVRLNHHGGLAATSSAVSTCLASSDSLFDTVPPVMEVSDSNSASLGTIYLFSILRDGLSYLAACPSEVSPLLILEFLHRIANTFADYFGTPTDENAIKENFSTVYQLLEEMLDNGWPLTTEPNALQDMIRPPTVMGKVSGDSGLAKKSFNPSIVKNFILYFLSVSIVAIAPDSTGSYWIQRSCCRKSAKWNDFKHAVEKGWSKIQSKRNLY